MFQITLQYIEIIFYINLILKFFLPNIKVEKIKVQELIISFAEGMGM